MGVRRRIISMWVINRLVFIIINFENFMIYIFIVYLFFRYFCVIFIFRKYMYIFKVSFSNLFEYFKLNFVVSKR